MRALLLFAIVPLLALAIPAHASSGACDGGVALGEVEVGDGTAAHTFYVDDRNELLGNGVWLYQETNGVFVGGDPLSDLQRGGDAVIAPYVPGGDHEICTDDPNVVPDTFFF